ncbi:cytochrome b [Undibacterium sp. SXout7W]|uniref:cytochrome b n=1 Tax=Undibacterium sp. SXout7W TaxID=3413049 RepID=UPI003BEFF301
MSAQSTKRYSLLTISLHWIVALLIIAAFALGSIMTDMKISPTKLQYYSYHKWLGVTVLGLVALRLLARLLSPAPAYPDSMSQWQQKAASLTHVGLYALMFAVPLSGYFYTSAAGYPVVYLGLFELPTFIAPNPELKPILKEVHETLTTVMLVVVGLHFAAALKHHFIDKDGILQRMLPGR